jgi:hypothetical protein
MKIPFASLSSLELASKLERYRVKRKWTLNVIPGRIKDANPESLDSGLLRIAPE